VSSCWARCSASAAARHYRNLLSKIFETAKKWGYNSGPNPAVGVELPEKIAVREKHILELEQVPRLLCVLSEPAGTMVRLALLTGLRVGEILCLAWNLSIRCRAYCLTSK
jgi:integrase